MRRNLMQNAIQIFESQEFGKLGVLMIDGKPHFPAGECAKALGYTRPNDAVHQHCRYTVKHRIPHPQSLNKTLEVNYIPEGDLYRLIIRSKLPTAERFEKWVFDEVLPSIRKHGAYINDDVINQMQEDSDYAAELLRNLTAERNRSNNLVNRVAQLTPKAHYHDIILQCPDSIPVTFIAKDYGMSGAAFNKLLYKLNVQFRIGRTWLLYAKHQRNGYTVTNTYTKNGMTTLVHTCWTQRGRFWLYELLKRNGILPTIERMAASEQMSFADAEAFAGS